MMFSKGTLNMEKWYGQEMTEQASLLGKDPFAVFSAYHLVDVQI